MLTAQALPVDVIPSCSFSWQLNTIFPSHICTVGLWNTTFSNQRIRMIYLRIVLTARAPSLVSNVRPVNPPPVSVKPLLVFQGFNNLALKKQGKKVCENSTPSKVINTLVGFHCFYGWQNQTALEKNYNKISASRQLRKAVKIRSIIISTWSWIQSRPSHGSWPWQETRFLLWCGLMLASRRCQGSAVTTRSKSSRFHNFPLKIVPFSETLNMSRISVISIVTIIESCWNFKSSKIT